MVALALVALPLVLVDFLVAYIWLTGLELGVSPFLIPFLYPCLYRYAFPLPTREPALEKHRALQCGACRAGARVALFVFLFFLVFLYFCEVSPRRGEGKVL